MWLPEDERDTSKQQAKKKLGAAFLKHRELIKGSGITDRKTKTLNILLPGAELAPSLVPFLQELLAICSNVKTVNITLVDLSQEKKEAFDRVFESDKNEIQLNYPAITINYTYITKDIRQVLSGSITENERYHIVYFEHPEIIGWPPYMTANTMRESMGLLPKVLTKKSIVVACTLNYVEMSLTKNVLTHVLNPSATASHVNDTLFTHYTSGSPYGTASFFIPKNIASTKNVDQLVQDKVNEIKKQDFILRACLVGTYLFFAKTMIDHMQGKKNLVPFNIAHTIGMSNFFLQDYGRRGSMIKAGILLLQAAVLIYAFTNGISPNDNAADTTPPHP